MKIDQAKSHGSPMIGQVVGGAAAARISFPDLYRRAAERAF
jgi:hypothetical protein